MAVTAVPGGEAFQSIKLDAAPSTPYVLTAVVPVPVGSLADANLWAGVRKGAAATDWFPTHRELIARTKSHDYYEITAYVDSGTDTLLEVDVLTQPFLTPIELIRGPGGILAPTPSPAKINTDAENTLHTPGAITLEFQHDRPGQPQQLAAFSLTGGFDTEGRHRMWSSKRQTSGYHRHNDFIRTYYKHVAVVPGGSMGYFHVFATVMAGTPEIQFELNWHNGGIEERTKPNQVPIGAGGDASTVPDTFGAARCRDVLFRRAKIQGLTEIPIASGFSGAWVWTPHLQQGGSAADTVHRPGLDGFIRNADDNDPNKLHILPIQFERPFRFAVHPSSVTPYAKRKIGFADWSKGGWNFTELGVPDYSHLSIDLGAEATTARTRLQTLNGYQVEGAANSGMIPVSALWPGNYGSYGGQTGGIGMWPWYGVKTAWAAQEAGLDILRVEQLRCRARTYGALYYNFSGFPVNVWDHAPAGRGEWQHFYRRFLTGSTGPRDLPFRTTRFPRRITEAAYNPGPRAGSSGINPITGKLEVGFQGFDQNGAQIDTPGDITPNVPDWYVAATALDVVETATLPYRLPQDQSTAPDQDFPDSTVPAMVQITGAETFDATKSITVQIVGIGDADIAITESVVLAGVASPPHTLAVQTAANFKRVDAIDITAKSGILVVTELVSVGRAPVGVPSYYGGDGITALDDQHSIRYHAANRTLFLLANDPLAKLYLVMDAADVRLTQWEGSGPANRIQPVEHGGVMRGNHKAREVAWACDMMSSAISILHAQIGTQATDLYWGQWPDAIVTLFNNSMMSNFLMQAISGKEFKKNPYGSLNGKGDGAKIFYGLAGRELAYFAHAISMLVDIKGKDYALLETKLRNMAFGFRDMAWKTSGSVGTGLHTYLPIALRRAGGPNGAIKGPDAPAAPDDHWTIYGNQSELPATNPVTGVLINPATFPAIDDDRFVTEVTGTAMTPDTPETLANAASDTGGPVPVKLTINGGATYTNAKRRTFRIVGTQPLGGALSEDLVVKGKGGATQTFQTYAHFGTVTSITLLSDPGGNDADNGALIVTELFRFGVPAVGIRQTGSSFPGLEGNPNHVEGYQLGYALGVFKHFGDKAGDSAAADTCILRFTGAGSLAAAKTEMETWTEYSGGPAGRLEQDAPCLWALRGE